MAFMTESAWLKHHYSGFLCWKSTPRGLLKKWLPRNRGKIKDKIEKLRRQVSQYDRLPNRFPGVIMKVLTGWWSEIEKKRCLIQHYDENVIKEEPHHQVAPFDGDMLLVGAVEDEHSVVLSQHSQYNDNVTRADLYDHAMQMQQGFQFLAKRQVQIETTLTGKLEANRALLQQNASTYEELKEENRKHDVEIEAMKKSNQDHDARITAEIEALKKESRVLRAYLEGNDQPEPFPSRETSPRSLTLPFTSSRAATANRGRSISPLRQNALFSEKGASVTTQPVIQGKKSTLSQAGAQLRRNSF